MSLAAPYQEHYYIADGEMITFPFGDFFQALSQNYVKCVIYFSDGTSCIPTFTVDMENQQITIVTLTKPDGTVLTVPPAGSVVRVYRETPEQQNVTASQLQNYTAKQLEKIFDSMVAMQQETSYSDLHKNIRLTEPQRDISIEPLTEAVDQRLLYWDEESAKIKATEYGQDEVIEQIERANTVADEAKTIAGKARDDLRDHEMDKSNPHETSMAKLTDTEIVDPERFQFLSFDGTKWKNVNYSATYTWGGIGGNIADQTDLFDTFVKKTGDTVSGMYKHSYGSRTRYLSANNTNKYMDVYMNDDIFTLYYHYTNSSTATLSMRSYVDGHFNIYPSSDKGGTIGFPSRRFEKIYTTHLCGSINGNNYLIVPDVGHSDTIATKSQVDLAANSGSQLYTTGVWYAKMYAATVVPTGAEYDGRNYADFSQVDSDNNPVIKIYTGASGAWTLTETITPPADYNGYMTITSKIWDIAEQSGQQGGQVLWDYTHKTFTPYPRIVSFESINITGNSTVVMPATPTDNSIPNKKYVDDLVTNSGTGRNVGDIFFTSRKDSTLNGAVECNGGTYNTTDFTGAQSIGDLLADGKVPYVSLSQYATLLSTNGSVGVFGWDGGSTTTFRVPSLNDIFIETGTSSQIGDFIPAGLPNITGSAEVYWESDKATVGAFYADTTRYNSERNNRNEFPNLGFDASRSNSIYGNSNTVQPKSVRYRAMVQLVISATDEAVATCTQVLSDVATMKSHEVIAFQAPTAENNYTWYRKYRDGWVEQGQGSHVTTGTTLTIILPVEMANTSYNISAIGTNPVKYQNTSTAVFELVVTSGTWISWQVSGIAAD